MERFPREKELYSILATCAHRNPNVVATDSANVMFNYQGQFAPMTTQQRETGMVRNLLELKGQLSITYKNTPYSIMTSLSFPYMYPDAPVVIRIYNPDIQRFQVNQHFISGSSPDGSVVNIQLPELQIWSSHKQIQRVAVQLVQQLQTHFPFFDRTYGPQVNSSINPPPYGYNQPYNPYNSQPQQPYNPQAQQPYNPQAQQPYKPQPQQPYNPQAQQPYNPYGQTGFPQQPVNNAPQQPYPYGANPAVEAQLRDKCILLLTQECQPVVASIKEQKNYANQLIGIVQQQEQKKKKLEDINRSIDPALEFSTQQIGVIQEALQQSDAVQLNESTVMNFIKEEDSCSTQLLDLMSEIQASREILHFIADRFKKNETITIEQLLRQTRGYSELLFVNQLLLNKCLKSAK